MNSNTNSKKYKRLVDEDLISFRESYILENKEQGKSIDNIAKDLRISRQRCHLIYQKANRKLCLPKCQAIMLSSAANTNKTKKYELEKAGVSSGVALKLYKYGIYNIKQLRMYPIDIIASIEGINIIQAKKLINKI